MLAEEWLLVAMKVTCLPIKKNSSMFYAPEDYSQDLRDPIMASPYVQIKTHCMSTSVIKQISIHLKQILFFLFILIKYTHKKSRQ